MACRQSTAYCPLFTVHCSLFTAYSSGASGMKPFFIIHCVRSRERPIMSEALR